MEPSYTDLLLQILSIMHFRDKEKFAAEFEELNYMEAMNNCIEKLPIHIQDEIIAHKAQPELIMKHVSRTMYKDEVITVATKALVTFIEHMSPVLTLQQKEQITSILNN